MKASELIEELRQLIEKHGDLPVTLAMATYEYSASDIGFVEEGPLPNAGDLQKQNPPDRFVIAAKDDIEDT
jgi:hypothetical protein